ncbi:hypothetical protein CAPTEDRAFT_218925 [Capitella teleta]|uniref:DUF4515 domain-containing protein n=1 Tax=Capitella teleta TaxID=283909 RepID=R7V259_CAPTE|nr:hypothetical protein CAPTEDRAFT_218925 [Capitella teleta]|eukprot:ELU12619.1 hypothetical protein CAPTEDRAFT_218925 [Capitella teleta]
MPPKKGKKGKGKGKDKKKGGSPAEGDETSEPVDKETLLKNELEDLTKDLESLKEEVEKLRQENDWLQQEAYKVRSESHEYMSYMEKKTNKRQITIISLSDHNQKEINDIREQKRQMLEDYEHKKTNLRSILMEKENMLAKTKQELDDLREFKTLQHEQVGRIKELEKEVMVMRGHHSDTIQQLKSRFLREKRDFQQDSDAKISSMSKQANKEAVQCLNEHTQRIKSENRQLRHQLLLLIRKTRALHEHNKHLEDQKKQLLLEEQYSEDLKHLRSARQHQVFKSFGMLEDEKNVEGGK